MIFRRRHADQLAAIAAAAERIVDAAAQIQGALNLTVPGGLAAVHAEAKGARQSAESAFAGVQALAAVAGEPGKLADAVAQNTRAVAQNTAAVSQVHAAVGNLVPVPVVDLASQPAPLAPGVSKPAPAGRGGQRKTP